MNITNVIGLLSLSLIIIPFYGESSAAESETLRFDTKLPFSFDVPSKWIYEENILLRDSGWVSTLYDSENWSVTIDISQYENPPSLKNLLDDEIVENTFLSYYYMCTNNTYDKIPFVDLNPELQALLFYHYNIELKESITETKDVTEWYYYLSEDELNDFFNPKIPDEKAPSINHVPEISDYLHGDMCSDFVPIEYEISKYDDFVRYQIFYTWKQNFADGTYYEHFSTSNDLWFNTNLSSHVISIDTKSSFEDFELHVDSVDNLIDSIKTHNEKSLPPEKISQNTRITFGLWANNQIHSADLYYEIGFLVNEKIIKNPTHVSNFDEIEITSVPDWLKNPSSWFYEGQIPINEFITLIEYLLEEQVIESKPVKKMLY